MTIDANRWIGRQCPYLIHKHIVKALIVRPLRVQYGHDGTKEDGHPGLKLYGPDIRPRRIIKLNGQSTQDKVSSILTKHQQQGHPWMQ